MAQMSLLGCGTWGSTLAQVLGRNGHSVTAWHYKKDVVDDMIRSRMHPNISDFEFHSNIIFKKEIQTCIEGSNCIVVAVPSHGVRNIIEKSSSFFTNKVILVNVAKGIENGTLSTMSEVIKDSSNLDSGQIVSLYGPSHAEEVIKGDPTTLVSASSDKSSAEYVQTIFSSDTLRVYTNNDIKGVELGGSLKNVIAIAAGICDGIGFGDNSKAALMTRGIAEITRLGVAMGFDSDTFSGLWILRQVTIKSPIPLSPENVSELTPIATPKRVISAIPRVISAAFELSPKPIPSHIPAAIAITFFSDPPSSTPLMSLLV
jgi:glycerol-3-phosphate dehydrogenase (NAD(P)+)